MANAISLARINSHSVKPRDSGTSTFATIFNALRIASNTVVAKNSNTATPMIVASNVGFCILSFSMVDQD